MSHDDQQMVQFAADDGRTLTGTFFHCASPKGIVLVNSGTAIPRQFYGKFATHLCSQGWHVLTFDYRGVGDSRSGPLKNDAARYRDWGQLDIPAAIRWCGQRCPDQRLFAVGHSTGGQQLGLAPNVDQIAAALFVCVSTGYWRGMPRPYRYMVWAHCYGVVPLTTRVLGYSPNKVFGWGENLPRWVVREWVAWSKHRDYLAAYFDKPAVDGTAFGASHFERVHFPIRAECFADDPIGTPENVPPMLNLYRSTTPDVRWHRPEDLGQQHVGHLGYFRPTQGKSLWPDATAWFEAHL